MQCGMRVVAIRRERSWMIEEVDGDVIPHTRGRAVPTWGTGGHHEAARAGGRSSLDSPEPAGAVLSDLDRAVDVLVEMKNISEAGVGLAYSALALRDVGLASEVRHLAERLDEMKDHLQLWVLRAAKADPDLSPLRGLLQLASAAEEIGNQANHMVWVIADAYELHPIVNIAFGEADVVATKVPVAAGSAADGRRLADLQLDIEPGFHVLAIKRDHRYLYRPRGNVSLRPGDELIVSGPAEGQNILAEMCGWWMEHHEDDPTGVMQLVPLDVSPRR
ncbi:MAG: hypothetical protein M5U19_12195 [Microthrixaceae bacterium]|nr:hypothetical protein [Microthrixaceae bacterium]